MSVRVTAGRSRNASGDRILPAATVAIAGLVLDLSLGTDLNGLEVYAHHLPFLVNGQAADCALRTHLVPVPDLEWGEKIFVSGGLWSLYRNDGQYIMPFISPRAGPRPYRLATFASDFSNGDLYVPPSDPYIRRDVPELGPGSVVVDPLLPPIDEVILVKLLSMGRGLYVHACGVSDGTRSVAFCGVSGAGKSTMANIWKGQPVTLQSDDRLVIRPVGHAFWAWGTPWHGDAHVSSPLGAQLEKLYFIVHAAENRITPLSPAEAARRLLVRCFPTFYDGSGMEYTLDIISQICSTVPCAELGFAPDERVVDLVWRDSLGG